jgi:hypothetical protein
VPVRVSVVARGGALPGLFGERTRFWWGRKMSIHGSIPVDAERRVHALSRVLTRFPLKYDGDAIKAWAGDSEWRAFRADLAHFRKHGYSGWGSAGFWALVIHRLQKVIRRRRPRWLWMPIRLTLGVVDKFFTMVTHTHIHLDAQVAQACSFLMLAYEYTAMPRSELTAQFTRYVPSEQGLEQAELP